MDLIDHRQEDADDCGPAALYVACRKFDVGPVDYAEYRGLLATTDSDGTTPSSLALVARNLGLHVEEFSGDYWFGELERHLGLGHPVICPIQTGGTEESRAAEKEGHYVVAFGLDDANVYVQDPAAGRVAMPREQFAADWHDHDAAWRRYDHAGIALCGLNEKAMAAWLKFNDCHDARGEFCSGSAGSTDTGSARPVTESSEAHGLLGKLAGMSWDALKDAGASAARVTAAASEYAKDGIAHAVEKLPEKIQGAVKGAWIALRVANSIKDATLIAGEKAAEAVALKRGATPEQAARLRSVCRIVDLATAKPLSVALNLSGMGHVSLVAGAVPFGSLSYLAYSGARVSSEKVLSAAKTAVATVSGSNKDADVLHSELLELVMDGMERHTDADGWYACLMVALDETQDLHAAINRANEAYEEMEHETNA